jgi:MFS family permease
VTSAVESVWRNGDFRLVWSGALVNNIGDWLLLVALPVFVFTETGSGTATAALVVIDVAISIVLGPLGGSLVDRWNLRLTLIATNVLQGVTLLPLLAVNSDRVWPAFVVAAAQGMLRQVNDPASMALLPRVVDESQLVSANAASAAANWIARLIGSPAGGIVVAVGGLSTVVIVDALTFVIGAATVWAVRTPTPSLVAKSDVDAAERTGSVRDGLRQIRSAPPLTAYVIVQALASLSFGMFPVVFIAFVVEELDGGGSEVGIIRGAAALGGIAASVAISRWAKEVRPWLMMMWGYLGFAVIGATFANASYVTHAVWLFVILFALSGFPNSSQAIGSATTAQRLCPPEVLGRLYGVLSATSAVGTAIGALGTGVLVERVGPVHLFDAQACVYLLCGVVTWLTIVRRAPA